MNNKIEKRNTSAIDQRERQMEKIQLLLIHFVLLSVLLVGISIGAKPVQAAETEHVNSENIEMIQDNERCMAKVHR